MLIIKDLTGLGNRPQMQVGYSFIRDSFVDGSFLTSAKETSTKSFSPIKSTGQSSVEE